MLNYTILLRALFNDLIELGIQRDLAVTAIRWFHPLAEDYVARVSEWQKFLCMGTADESLTCGPWLVRYKVAQCWGSGFALRTDCTAFTIRALHQTAMLFWKEEVPVDPDWESFKTRLATSGTPDLDHPIIGKLAKFCENLLGEAPSWDEIEGTCGSGATAEQANNVERWAFQSIPLYVPANFYEYNEHDNYHARQSMIPYCRASAVPKNRKSARIVASECAAAMFAQLGVMRAFDKRLCNLRRRVPLHNADIHRSFLRSHSDAVTLDLSDASDYISMDLANAILPASWAALCNACRSQVVVTPDGAVTRLATFAPMGNGFCFRVLSVVCAGVLAVCCKQSWSDFGDDMICRQADYGAVTCGLKACGLVLNESKCGLNRFVETCGLELFDGVDVTPLKLKRLLSCRGNYEDIGAALRAAYRNLHHVAGACYSGLHPCKSRFNHGLQLWEYRYPCWVTVANEAKVDDWPGMMRWHAIRASEHYRDTVNIYAQTRPGFRWCRSKTDTLTLSDIEDLRSRCEALTAVDVEVQLDLLANAREQSS